MKFGVREIVDVVFKAADDMTIGSQSFSKYQPVFMIDTATTSSLEQATTTVYAQGGQGYARLIAWEGEKTMTFTVTDALMSPMGLAVLTGAGLIKPEANKPAHAHMTINKTLNASGVAEVTIADLKEETGLDNATSFAICTKSDVKPYATKLDGSGAGIAWYDHVAIGGGTASTGGEFITIDNDHPATFTVTTDGTTAASGTVQLDFYLIMNNSDAVTEVNIEPGSFGGYFYIEAQTLFRREDSGKDMAAEIIIPKAKVQSAFTFTMAASGDPSTFDFVMDAFPGYTRFDATQKLMCKIQVLGSDKAGEAGDTGHTHTETPDPVNPSFNKPDSPTPEPTPVGPNIDISGSSKVDSSKVPTDFADYVECQGNQDKANVTIDGDAIKVAIVGGVSSLNTWTSTDAGQAILGDKPWIALDINTGLDDITKVKYNGSALTAQDAADAAAWGLPAGHFILWIKADDVQSTPKTFTLGGEDLTTKTVTITVEDSI